MTYDRVIIGGGMFGLYAAKLCGRAGYSTVVLEADSDAMLRASFVNQARVHNGYHYPRSMGTAKQAGQYFKRFSDEFDDCVNRSFTKIYATSKNFSWTNAAEFEKFCSAAGIRCEQIDHRKFFNEGVVDGVFLTEEYSFDAELIRAKMLNELGEMGNVQILFNHRVEKIEKKSSWFAITSCGEIYETEFVLNASYASANEILDMAGFDPLPTKYELCEIILGEPNEALRPYGITVMDGPFFSVMPFGCSEYHSLTSVCFTPHATSYDKLPTLNCQNKRNDCFPGCLQNCDLCCEKPESAFHYMHGLMRKYLKEEYEFNYVRSHFALKLILKTSEVDDSRPTVIKESSKDPTFITVLSGKINTIYDLEEVLLNG
ncbi:MAG: FAD-dependent oxidoreductase [Oscillospiraceae bacterium]|nr:FAD-dependent oxidoreductase [Oscillospiraceae bacterium]